MATKGWSVINARGHIIDTVFYSGDCDADYVRRSLIDHDHYRADITVRPSGYQSARLGIGDKHANA